MKGQYKCVVKHIGDLFSLVCGMRMHALTLLFLFFYDPKTLMVVLILDIVLDLAVAFNDFVFEFFAALTAFIRESLGAVRDHLVHALV